MTSPEARVWVKHRDTGQFWQCPSGALGHFELLGWQVADQPPPDEPNPAVAERLAWEAEQARLAEEAAAEEKAASKSTTKSAARGDSKE